MQVRGGKGTRKDLPHDDRRHLINRPKWGVSEYGGGAEGPGGVSLGANEVEIGLELSLTRYRIVKFVEGYSKYHETENRKPWTLTGPIHFVASRHSEGSTGFKSQGLFSNKTIYLVANDLTGRIMS